MRVKKDFPNYIHSSPHIRHEWWGKDQNGGARVWLSKKNPRKNVNNSWRGISALIMVERAKTLHVSGLSIVK